jgi:hypothetical protein
MAAGPITLIIKDSQGFTRQAKFWSSDGTEGGFLSPIQYLDPDQLASVIAALGIQTNVTTTGGAKAYSGDQTADVVLEADTPRAVALYNRGGVGAGDFVTFDVDADATGADAERRLYVGQRLILANGGRFTARISVFAADPTTIEWETWA